MNSRGLYGELQVFIVIPPAVSSGHGNDSVAAAQEQHHPNAVGGVPVGDGGAGGGCWGGQRSRSDVIAAELEAAREIVLGDSDDDAW